MKESPFYQRIMQEGEVKTQRAHILKVLRLRFGPAAADEFSPAVNALENSGRLEKLHDLAVASPDLTAFRNAFAGKKKKRQ